MESMDTKTRTVSIYTRHLDDCPKFNLRDWKRCDCPKWLYMNDHGKRTRTSAKSSSWAEAERQAQQIRDSWDPIKVWEKQQRDQKAAQQVQLADAIDKFIAMKEAALGEQGRDYKPSTRKHRQTLGKLKTWAHEQKPPIFEVGQLSAAALEDFLINIKCGVNTRRSHAKRLKVFFKWMAKRYNVANVASDLPKISGELAPTLPYTDEQFNALLKSVDIYSKEYAKHRREDGQRFRALLTLMRWSGLRAGDAVNLSKDRIEGSRLLISQTTKSKSAVYVPLPPDVVQELQKLPACGPDHYFTSGSVNPVYVTNEWQKKMLQLAAIAHEKYPKLFDGEHIHFHRLRDTFAVWYLEHGTSLEDVSKMLGHSSVKITEAHYAPWVPALQNRLENAVHNAWKQAKKAAAGR